MHSILQVFRQHQRLTLLKLQLKPSNNDQILHGSFPRLVSEESQTHVGNLQLLSANLEASCWSKQCKARTKRDKAKQSEKPPSAKREQSETKRNKSRNFGRTHLAPTHCKQRASVQENTNFRAKRRPRSKTTQIAGDKLLDIDSGDNAEGKHHKPCNNRIQAEPMTTVRFLTAGLCSGLICAIFSESCRHPT